VIPEPFFDLAPADKKTPSDAVSGKGVGARLNNLVAFRSRDPQPPLKLQNGEKLFLLYFHVILLDVGSFALR
jgi:hypothetical protein